MAKLASETNPMRQTWGFAMGDGRPIRRGEGAPAARPAPVVVEVIEARDEAGNPMITVITRNATT